MPRVLLGQLGGLVIVASAAILAGSALAADRGFPFDRELMLDVRPMKGSKRVPIMEVAPDGRATIDLWCNSVEGKIVVVDSSITVTTGRQTDRECDPARMRGDEELLSALSQVVTWTRDRDLLTLRGPKILRFRQPSN